MKTNKLPSWAVFLLGCVAGLLLAGLILLLFFLFKPKPANDETSASLSAASNSISDSTASDNSTDIASNADIDTSTVTASLWNKETAYTGGQQVIYDGALYTARWWTQGEKPDRSNESVWEYLGEIADDMTSAQSNIDLPPSITPRPGTEDFKVVVYYPSWKEGHLDKLRFDIVTHVNYAFAIPTADGGLLPLENPDLAKSVIDKAHSEGAYALLAVGGWSHNDVPLEATFKSATETPEKLKSFGDAILKMVDEYGFDGVDMDWEHPRLDDKSKDSYEALMVYLRSGLGDDKLLTAAVLSGATPDGTVYYDAAAHTDTVLAVCDYINVMAYDGGDGARHSSYDFAVECGKYWNKTRSLAPEKVVLGVPFYARPSWAAYADILAADSAAHSKDISTYNGMEAHYNGMDTISKKTQYALDNLGGVMVWEITQDTTDWQKSLLTAIGKVLE